MNFSSLCSHRRLVRVDKHFDKCLDCEQTIINHMYNNLRNKTRQEFTRENNSFDKNFDKNFSNKVDIYDSEKSENSLSSYQSANEYYCDRKFANIIKIDRQTVVYSTPRKYIVYVNGLSTTLLEDQIQELLASTGSVRIDVSQYEQLIHRIQN